jgi:hypothetical protein
MISPSSEKWFSIPEQLPTEEGVYIVKTVGLFSTVGGTLGGEYIDTYSPSYGWGGFQGAGARKELTGDM